MKLLESNLVRLALTGLFLGIVFKGSQATLPTLQALPIYGMNVAPRQNIADDHHLKNLYPLVASHDKAVIAEAPSSEIINIDSAFIPQITIQKNVQSNVPDYFSLLKENNVLMLQAITNDGAIINGKFYAFNSTITDFAYPSGSGKEVSPTLIQATASSVIIKETPGQHRFVLTLAK